MRMTAFRFLAPTVGILALVSAPVWADGNLEEGWTRVDRIEVLDRFFLVNSCNGDEIVMLTGQRSSTRLTKFAPDGTLSIKESGSTLATGVGLTSGVDYTLSDTSILLFGLGQLPVSTILNRVSKLSGDG